VKDAPNGSDGLPPRDSWIRLKPGSGRLQFDRRLQLSWEDQARLYREFRGEILAGAFEIEYVIDQIIVEALFPQANGNELQRGLFDEIFLKGSGSRSSLVAKIETLRALVKRHAAVASALADVDFTKLNQVREVRNNFAHFPISFEPLGEIPHQTLAAVLCTRHGEIALGDDFIEEHSRLLGEMLDVLDRARKRLVPDTPEAK
jgi:hypothetical protein